MRRLALFTLPLAMLAAWLMITSQQSAEARPNYKAAWDQTYLKEGTPIYQALSGKSNCNICHEGKDRKNRNEYGAAIGKNLGMKNNKDNAQIAAALQKAAEAKSTDGPTFGELIEQGKLKPTP